MNCAQFERELQRLADGEPLDHDEVVMQLHASECGACRDLEEGFRLIAQGFVASRETEPSPELTDRIMATLSAAPAPRRRAAGWLVPLATAAGLALSLTWRLAAPPVTPSDQPISVPQQPPSLAREGAAESPLFPELAEVDEDGSTDDALIGEAMRPVSQMAQAFGRTLQRPARPIGLAASEAIGNLLRDLPDPNTTMMSMPLMRGLMPEPMQKAMKPMGPS
jgi:hypothetical protein